MIQLDVPSILNEDFIVNAEPMQGFIFTLLSVCGTIALSGIIYGYADHPSPSTKICILGQKESGKTTLYKWLQHGKFVQSDTQTSTDEYKEFTYKGHRIDSGTDIGGGEAYFYEYEQKIKECDICIFTFDVYKFLRDYYYREETWVRADLIYRKCNEGGSQKRLFTIGTHLDMTSFSNNPSQAINRVVDISSNQIKCINVFNSSNFMVADLRQSGFENCLKKIFN
ncbi:MAG: hypothetical protein II852_08900 [Bacteroidales bacterium]|nr:hypothetical protein [Bacteroidales bacterium]